MRPTGTREARVVALDSLWKAPRSGRTDRELFDALGVPYPADGGRRVLRPSIVNAAARARVRAWEGGKR